MVELIPNEGESTTTTTAVKTMATMDNLVHRTFVNRRSIVERHFGLSVLEA